MEKYYKLRNLAEYLNKTEDDILQMAANEQLTLSVWWGGKYLETEPDGKWMKQESPLNDFVNIDCNHAKQLLFNPNVDTKKGICVDDCYLKDGKQICLIEHEQYNKYISIDWTDEEEARSGNNIDYTPVFHRSSIVVLAEELARAEANYPDIRQQFVDQDQKHQKSEILPQAGKRGKGRTMSFLGLAVEYLYDKYLMDGDIDILRANNINKFLHKLRENVRANKDRIEKRTNKSLPENYDPFEVPESNPLDMIESASCETGIWIIKTEEKITRSTDTHETKLISRDYYQNDVTKHLTRLRREKPLPPKISIL